MNFEYDGLLGLVILVADIYAIVTIARGHLSTVRTVVWILVIVLLPVLGFLAWWLFGPRARGA